MVTRQSTGLPRQESRRPLHLPARPLRRPSVPLVLVLVSGAADWILILSAPTDMTQQVIRPGRPALDCRAFQQQSSAGKHEPTRIPWL